jgi:hypothetical protein
MKSMKRLKVGARYKSLEPLSDLKYSVALSSRKNTT